MHNLKPFFALLLCAVCSAGPVVDQPWQNLQVSNNKFAVGLFKECASESNSSNLMISPLSAYIALAMTADGSDGNTYKQFHDVLGLPEKSVSERVFKKLISEFNVHKDVELSVANTILVDESLGLKPEFEALAKSKFSSPISTFNSAKAQEAADKVNQWASNSTHGKIKEMVNKADMEDKDLMLLNAVYFKGDWRSPFDEESTETKKFHAKDSEKDVKMMIQTAHFTNGELDNLRSKFVELPYKNKDYKLTIVLPNEDTNVDEVIKKFGPSILDDIKEARASSELILSVPKFKIESKIDMKNPLIGMGLRDMFDSKADLTKFSTSSDLYVSDVKQKTFIDVNERGSEAAAVTEVGIVGKSLDSDEPVEFTVDRPSLFFITKGNTILFLGQIKDPEYAN